MESVSILPHGSIGNNFIPKEYLPAGKMSIISETGKPPGRRDGGGSYVPKKWNS